MQAFIVPNGSARLSRDAGAWLVGLPYVEALLAAGISNSVRASYWQ
jgi:hypothetical protein